MAEIHREQRLPTVFVVDDNDVVRRVISGIVRQDKTLMFLGEAANGESAVEALIAKTPDVVCLDFMMPGLDGVEVLERVREKSPATKVVMITGYPTPDLVQKARALGASGFVVKPFNAAKVLSVIHAALAAPVVT